MIQQSYRITSFLLLIYIIASWIINVNANDAIESINGCMNYEPSIKFSNPKAKAYEVGNNIPTLPFKTKTSWAGLMPLEGSKLKNASLFFWFWSQDSLKSGEDLVLWLAGGPGCSSILTGMFEESGPFLYRTSGHLNTTINEYSWTKVTNLLYVDYPVGVSLSTGESEEISGKDSAESFVSFLENFFNTFSELQSKKFYLAGVSWAGQAIPYIYQALEKKKPKNVPKIRGSLIIDGLITSKNESEDLVAYQFASENQKILNITDQDLQKIKLISDQCNLTNYIDQNLNYPPKGRLPDFSSKDCPVWETVGESIPTEFDMYNIASPPNSDEDEVAFQAIPNIFDDPKLQNYIHSPEKRPKRCVKHIFGGKNVDLALPPDRYPDFHHSILAKMIEQNERTIITSGNYDFRLITNGTALALQNLTWNGLQGFSKRASKPLYDVNNQERGVSVTERNLTFAIIPKSGHFMVHDQPATGLAAVLQLIGKGDWNEKNEQTFR